MANNIVPRSATATKPLEEISDHTHMATPPGESPPADTEEESAMNMMSRISQLTDAATRPTDWNAALDEYQAARAFADGLPPDHAHGDAAVDAYCKAIDHLVEKVRAPSHEALTVKLELARERWDGLTMPNEWLNAFQSDLASLGEQNSAVTSFPLLDSNHARSEAEVQRLYYAYRSAKAAYDLAQYAPENIDRDLPKDLDDKLSNALCQALNAYLMAPTDDLYQFAKKMRVFRQEEIQEGWYAASTIVAVMERDIWRAIYKERNSE